MTTAQRKARSAKFQSLAAAAVKNATAKTQESK